MLMVRQPGRRGGPVLHGDLQELEARDHLAVYRSWTRGARETAGQPFTALNGGPVFTFNEAISFPIMCGTQEEIDDYWNKLSEGGDPNSQQCGWLKDKYGVSWQVVPTALVEMMNDADKEKSGRAMEAMLQMKKLDIAKLKRAYAGTEHTSTAGTR